MPKKNKNAKPPVICKITSSDGEAFNISLPALRKSVTLGNLIDVLVVEPEEINEKEPIPVPKVDSEVLKKVIEWCEHHRNDAQDITDREDMFEWEIPQWDIDFLAKNDNDQLLELICAANYLDINGLFKMGCRTVAGQVNGKSPEEMRAFFELDKDESEIDDDYEIAHDIERRSEDIRRRIDNVVAAIERSVLE